MNIIVCIQQLRDPSVRLSIDDVGQSIVQAEAEPVHLLNPADRCALEAALKVAASHPDVRVKVLTLGPREDEEVLRYCLARGADTAIRIWSEAMRVLDAYLTASLLARALSRFAPDLVLCGDCSIWGGGAQVPALIAEFLDMPQLSHATDVSVCDTRDRLHVQRRVERGSRLLVECPLPCVIAIAANAFPVRYVSLSSRNRQTGDIACLTHEDLAFSDDDLSPVRRRVSVIGLSPPKPRTKKSVAPAAGGGNMMSMMGGNGAGGTAKKPAGGLVRGTPSMTAKEIVSFLKEKGFL